MKKPFDRIVGPEGEWIYETGLTEREEFAFRCLNAAANLYGVVTMDEMTAVYNHYAAGHGVPISGPMDGKELLEIAEGLLAKELDDTWFSIWLDDKSGVRAADTAFVLRPSALRRGDDSPRQCKRTLRQH